MKTTPLKKCAQAATVGRSACDVRAWLQLVRPPNLFTVPGDPLAGFFLAGGGAWWPAACAALAAIFLYMGGLLGNDVADFAEDRRDRPSRPLPSGRVSRGTAFLASVLCALIGLLLAFGAGWGALAMACLTQAAIVLYNGWFKHHAIPGALMMGACRGFSLLIGAAAAHPHVWNMTVVTVAAAGVTLYIAAVTWIADRETAEVRIGPRRWLPLLAWLATAAWLAVRHTATVSIGPFLLPAILAVGWTAKIGSRLSGIPPRAFLGASIGGLIRGLLLIQAACAAFGGTTAGLTTAVALLALWPFSVRTARWFYAT